MPTVEVDMALIVQHRKCRPARLSRVHSTRETARECYCAGGFRRPGSGKPFNPFVSDAHADAGHGTDGSRTR